MNYRSLPPFGGDPRAVAEVVNGLMQGKSNNTGSVTLTTGTSTTLDDSRIGATSILVFMPITSDAAGTTVWVSARNQGQATLAHASGTADRTYDYAVIG